MLGEDFSPADETLAAVIRAESGPFENSLTGDVRSLGLSDNDACATPSELADGEDDFGRNSASLKGVGDPVADLDLPEFHWASP